MKTKIITSLLLLSGLCLGHSQGFINLDFESANLTGYSSGNLVPATNAFPSWTINGAGIIYDNFSLSGNSISIMDTNSPFSSLLIQGTYYAFLASGNYQGTGVPISIGQTGMIPLWAQTISFWGDIGGLQITFSNQPLVFFVTGSTANYNIYTADISPYSGQTGQLLFTLPPYVNSATLDNIQFSSTAVPEPGTLALAGFGISLLGFRRWRMG